jgi:drug/metabolite transporter (DMT)-like permease
MIIPLFFSFAGGLALVVLGLGYKHASVKESRAGAYGSIFTGTAFAIGAVYSLFEASAWTDWRLWAIGGGMGMVYATCVGIFTRANQIGPVTVSWVVINLSTILAIALSMVFLKEKFLWVDIPIVVLFAGMIFVLNVGMRDGANTSKGGAHPLFWPLILSVFALNGFYIFMMKIKAGFFPDNSNGATMAICFGAAGVLMLSAHVIGGRRRPGEPLWRRDDVVAGLLTGVGAGFGNVLIVQGMTLPSVVVYPISQGIPLIGGVVAMAIFYRERFNRAKVASLLIAIVVLFLTIVRDKICG